MFEFLHRRRNNEHIALGRSCCLDIFILFAVALSIHGEASSTITDKEKISEIRQAVLITVGIMKLQY